MSSEKKVLVLFLLLIAFISWCVYSHLPQFMEKQQVSNTTSQEEIVAEEKETPIKVIEEEPKEVLVPEEDSQITIENEVVENNGENLVNEENIESKPEENLEQKDIVEEVIEEPKEPLITTGENYIREGDEKRIEELSFETQELQITINEYIEQNPISFKRGSFNLANNKSVDSIKEIVKILDENPNIKLEVAGHTDAAGSKKVNLTYSLERAKTVVKAMVNLGIDENRVKARGYGEDIPKDTKNVYSKINRRVEFNIVEE